MEIHGLVNHYETLGVARDADETIIKKAYRKLVLKWHPDKHPEDREIAEEKIRAINNAYEVLSNPTKKSSYDQQWIALERKSQGIALVSSGISPRMSIPKEFLMSPLGHSDKFVRYQGWNLFVQNRDDVAADFHSFFHVAKFSLWWLPEINNMCRIRAAATAGAGVSGGVNLCFSLGPNKEESEISMTTGTDPQSVNFIAVNSPTMAGAFRFEVPYYPGHYLAFIQPNHMKVISQVVDSVTTTLDFAFVDYSMMFKYILMEEVLIPAMYEIKGNEKFVPLDSLRCNASVMLYFRNILGKNVWDAEDFQTYFEGHYDKWDYDSSKNSVRLRSKDEVLAQQLKAAKRTSDIAQVLASADESGIDALSLVSLERVLASLAEEPVADCSVTFVINRMAASKKILDSLPKIIRNKPNLRIQRLLFTAKVLEDFPAPDDQIQSKKELARNALGKLITESIVADSRIVGTEVNIDELTMLFSLPINWSECADELVDICDAIWPTLPMEKYEEFLILLGKSAPQSKILRLVCEKILPRLLSANNRTSLFLQCLQCFAVAPKVVEMLDASLFSADEYAKVAILIAERELAPDHNEQVVQRLVLEQCSSDTLMHMTVCATKCAAFKPIMRRICATMSQMLPELSVEDISKVLFAASKAVAHPEELDVLMESAECYLTRTVILTMSAPQIIKSVLAVRGCGTHAGKKLLERLASVAVEAHLSMPTAQLVLLTQGMVPQLDETDVFQRLLEFWEQTLSEALQAINSDAVTQRRQEMEQRQLQADQVAKLGQALSKTKTATKMKGLWSVLRKNLTQKASQLSVHGHTCLDSFPESMQGYVSALKRARRRSPSRSRSWSRSRAKAKSRSRSRSTKDKWDEKKDRRLRWTDDRRDRKSRSRNRDRSKTKR